MDSEPYTAQRWGREQEKEREGESEGESKEVQNRKVEIRSVVYAR